ncbi:MAG TPA: hypothetical protein PKA64_02935, partial [Myxococcota bacterium]|nr:hypothetical protein [Myxococcota bacterium]
AGAEPGTGMGQDGGTGQLSTGVGGWVLGIALFLVLGAVAVAWRGGSFSAASTPSSVEVKADGGPATPPAATNGGDER